MAARCTVCAHKDRHAIDMALTTKQVPERALAKRYGIASSSMHRHATTHVPKLLASVAERVGMLEADQLMAQTLSLYERTLELLAEAESNVARAATSQDKSRALAASTGAIREARHVMETLAKVNLAARQELAAQDHAASTPVDVRPDLDAEIARRLARRGMPAHGERKHDPAPMLALPPSSDADVVDAELVD